MGEKIRIVLELTQAQADALEEAVSCYGDEGPEGSGWKSTAMEQVCDLVTQALRRQEPK
jgi:hypothetical protein